MINKGDDLNPEEPDGENDAFANEQSDSEGNEAEIDIDANNATTASSTKIDKILSNFDKLGEDLEAIKTSFTGDHKYYKEVASRIDDIEARITKISGRSDNLSELIKSMDAERKDRVDELGKLKKEIDESKKQLSEGIVGLKKQSWHTIEVIAIFISFFTFISVDYQLLASSNINIVEAIGLILIMAGILIGFCIVLDVVIMKHLKLTECNSDERSGYFRFHKNLAVVVVGLMLLGLACVFQVYSDKDQATQATIDFEPPTDTL